MYAEACPYFLIRLYHARITALQNTPLCRYRLRGAFEDSTCHCQEFIPIETA